VSVRAAAACLLALAAAGCGGGDEQDGQDDPAAPTAVDLTVVVWPKGPDGPSERRRIVCQQPGRGSPMCRGLAGLKADQLAPVPRDVACTQIYGGPATARVRGRLPGGRVDARFARSDGCQIERWDRNRVLLGD
jgi:hypothetical protein